MLTYIQTYIQTYKQTSMHSCMRTYITSVMAALCLDHRQILYFQFWTHLTGYKVWNAALNKRFVQVIENFMMIICSTRKKMCWVAHSTTLAVGSISISAKHPRGEPNLEKDHCHEHRAKERIRLESSLRSERLAQTFWNCKNPSLVRGEDSYSEL